MERIYTQPEVRWIWCTCRVSDLFVIASVQYLENKFQPWSPTFPKGFFLILSLITPHLINRSRGPTQCLVSAFRAQFAVVSDCWLPVPDVTANNVQEQRPLQCIATNGRSSSSQLLAKLNSAMGITSQEFQGLFVKCDLCKCIMMHHTFTAHNCSVIDLTRDTETEEQIFQ